MTQPSTSACSITISQGNRGLHLSLQPHHRRHVWRAIAQGVHVAHHSTGDTCGEPQHRRHVSRATAQATRVVSHSTGDT